MKKIFAVLSLFIGFTALSLSDARAQVQVAVVVTPRVINTNGGVCGHQSSYHDHNCNQVQYCNHGQCNHHHRHDNGCNMHHGNGRGNGHGNKYGHGNGHGHH
jgi:hypothetical protein